MKLVYKAAGIQKLNLVELKKLSEAFRLLTELGVHISVTDFYLTLVFPVDKNPEFLEVWWSEQLLDQDEESEVEKSFKKTFGITKDQAKFIQIRVEFEENIALELDQGKVEIYPADSFGFSETVEANHSRDANLYTKFDKPLAGLLSGWLEKK